MYLFVLSVVGMATAGAMIALASTDGLVEQTVRGVDGRRAELLAHTAGDIALELIEAESSPLVRFGSGTVVDLKAGETRLRAWLTDPDGKAVTPSGSSGVRLWTEGVGANARSLRSVDLDLRADPTPGGDPGVLALSPIAYWPMNMAGGTFARDVIGSAHGEILGGVEVGATPSPVWEPAAQFDGRDGRVVVAHETWMERGEWSLSLWFRVDETSQATQTIVSKDAETGLNQFEVVYTSDGALAFCEKNASAAFEIANAGVEPGRWHHLVLSYDGRSIEMVLDARTAADGRFDYATGGGNNKKFRNQEPLIFGAGQRRAITGTGEPVDNALAGSIAEVAFFDRVLDRSEAEALLAAGSDGTPGLSIVAGSAARRSD